MVLGGLKCMVKFKDLGSQISRCFFLFVGRKALFGVGFPPMRFFTLLCVCAVNHGLLREACGTCLAILLKPKMAQLVSSSLPGELWPMSTLGCLVGFLVPFAVSQYCPDGISHLQTHTVSTGGVDGLRQDGRLEDPNDYYECTKDSDCNRVNIQNVGAACCSGDNTCAYSAISLAAGGTCTHDVCCSGINSCSGRDPGDMTMAGVSSLSCNGPSSCVNVAAPLSQDLFCTGNTACGFGTFDFEAGEQCIVCSDENGAACREATFTISTPANSEDVTNALCTGDSACQESTWTVASGKKMRLYCEGDSSCRSISVTLESGSSLRLFCDGAGACFDSTITKQSLAECQCTKENDGQCPSGCTSSVSIDRPTRCAGEDTACCAAGCAACGCGETTTTTLTTNGGAIGDPHMETLDGKHYMLLRQGTFSLWGFTGSLSQVRVKLINGDCTNLWWEGLFFFHFHVLYFAREAPG